MKSNNLLGLSCQELVELAESLSEKPFRGKQLYHQIYRRRISDFDAMTNLSKAFRTRLQDEYTITYPDVFKRTASADGTTKFLFRLEDGSFVESVYIPEESRDTLCISSQVGCDVGCTFCMTAQMGFQRNLRPGEILGQVLQIVRSGLAQPQGFNIVFMGMGEPLYNYQNLMKAFRILTDPEGIDISYRKITVSTSGIVPVLKKLAQEPKPPNLAISLNATTNEVRDRVMPVNRKWPLEELLQACREFPLDSRRRITMEYVLLKEENDSIEDARRLAGLLRGISVKVNLIPYNPNPGLSHRRPEEERIQRFRSILQELNVPHFIRKTRGDDVSAACGQLAYLEKSPSLATEPVLHTP
ncbi:MAG: 23S rRNA (adenine(2503)-C(2))-methyltransferase RlmN [Acidobacteriota bacterium]|nr:MAG: 23S rRNA (adenine(2503)-C(2))-methyltransferase RlmN [Acidobacteriota bacterium]